MELILAGATGLVGAEVLKQALLDTGITKIKLITRRPLPTQDPKVESIVVSDFSELESLPKPSPSSVAICSLGTTIKQAGSQEVFRKADHDAVVSFGKFTSDVQTLAVVSAMEANAQSKIFYNKVKGETERDLELIGHKRLVLFQPGLLVGDRNEKRFGEEVALGIFKISRVILPESVNRAWATEVTELAAKMLAEVKGTGVGVYRIPASKI